MNRVLLTVDAIDAGADDEQLATLVSDTGDSIVVPLAMLPDGTRAGDVLTVTLQRDVDETSRRRQRVAELQKRLFG